MADYSAAPLKENVMRFYFSSGIFWGIVFILIGILFLIRNYTNIYIPIFRTIFGLLIIYWGLTILFGGSARHSKSSAVFSENTVNVDSTESHYGAVFGKSTINFTDSTLTEIKQIDMEIVFGEGILRINKNIPVKLKIDGAFSSISTPYGTQPFLGSSVSTNKLFDKSKPYLFIKTDVVFGSLKIEEI
ncbi:MAG: hypothetical protein GWP03_05595 [Proteobacteria bacterium]|nr:hypothetical protein [Pseudomonadota bacterium]